MSTIVDGAAKDGTKVADDIGALPPEKNTRYPRDGAVTVEHITGILRELVEPAEGQRWLSTPQDVFDGRTPNDLIANGETDRVYQVLVRLEEGIHV